MAQSDHIIRMDVTARDSNRWVSAGRSMASGQRLGWQWPLDGWSCLYHTRWLGTPWRRTALGCERLESRQLVVS